MMRDLHLIYTRWIILSYIEYRIIGLLNSLITLVPWDLTDILNMNLLLPINLPPKRSTSRIHYNNQ